MPGARRAEALRNVHSIPPRAFVKHGGTGRSPPATFSRSLRLGENETFPMANLWRV